MQKAPMAGRYSAVATVSPTPSAPNDSAPRPRIERSRRVPIAEHRCLSGSGWFWLTPASGRWIGKSGDGCQGPRDAPSSKDQEDVSGHFVVSFSRDKRQLDGPNHQASDAVDPKLPVLRHVDSHLVKDGGGPRDAVLTPRSGG